MIVQQHVSDTLHGQMAKNQIHLTIKIKSYFLHGKNYDSYVFYLKINQILAFSVEYPT